MAAMKRAMERNPFVVLGTVMSTSTIVNMTILQEAGIPQITGSEGTAITQKGNPNIFRTSYNPSLNMQKLVKFILESFKAKKLGVIYVNNVLGKSGRDAVMEQLKGKLEIVADIATEEGQADFTGELSRLKASGADTLYLHTHEEEGGKVMVQFKQMGLKLNVCSAGLDLSHVARLAKESADGLVGFDEPYGAPDSPLGKKYHAKYGEDIDSEAVKGYIAPHVVRAVVNKIKSFDQQKFRDALHKHTICTKDEPGVLWDLHYNEHGDIDRESVMITIEKGKLKVLQTMPPLNPENFGMCKK
jgi:branched-chain amino acid transport system substrate-binding protein